MPPFRRNEDADEPAARGQAGDGTGQPAAITPLRERLRPLQARVSARRPTGLEADKAFYDDLNGCG